MVIVIDLTSVSYHLSGIERYAVCVTDKLVDLDTNNQYILIFRNEVHPIFKDRIDNNRVRAIVLHGNNKLFFLQITLMKALRSINADKYLFLAYPSPLAFNRKGIINTIHDMGAWDSAEEAQSINKYYFRISYKHAAKISEKIVTVSDFSRGRIAKILKVNENNIAVVNSGVYDDLLKDSTVSFQDIQEEYHLPSKYILTLSTLEPRKNMIILLEAFSAVADEVDYDLVLVGRKGWKMDDVLEKYKAKDRIHITGFVKDEHLSSVYQNAMCFVFPSLYEGFGLPPVEALSLGVPVISSDAASLPEILMEQAVYFKNNSVDELKGLLVKLEDKSPLMPHGLNEFQKVNYSFVTAAKKIIELL